MPTPSRDSAKKLPQIHVLRDPLSDSRRMARGTPPPQVIAKPRAVAAAAVKTDYVDPASTLIGIGATRADTAADTIIDGTRFGIAPAQVAAAIERVKKQAAEPVTDRIEKVARGSHAKWHEFEEIGLGMQPSKAANRAAKLAVSMYRLIGFAILTLIVIVLIGYIGMTAFYFASHTWVTPVAISPSDDKIVALQSQLATQQNERDKLVGDLGQAERAITAEQMFQLEFARAIKRDLDGRQAALARVRQLASAAASTRAQIRATNNDYSAQTVERMTDEYKAGLIDRQQMLAGKYQLAQITSSNLSLAERQAEFEQRAAELAAETQSLDAILADKVATGALSYDVLKIKRDYDASKLELAKDLEARDRLRDSIARQDKIVEGLRQSAYLRALSDHATVALVPYSNLDNAAKGTKLYACRVEMLVCRQVGVVLDVLPGEVQVKHPHRDSILRGRMIEMQMTDTAAAEDEVLFAGGAPLGL